MPSSLGLIWFHYAADLCCFHSVHTSRIEFVNNWKWSKYVPFQINHSTLAPNFSCKLYTIYLTFTSKLSNSYYSAHVHRRNKLFHWSGHQSFRYHLQFQNPFIPQVMLEFRIRRTFARSLGKLLCIAIGFYESSVCIISYPSRVLLSIGLPSSFIINLKTSAFSEA